MPSHSASRAWSRPHRLEFQWSRLFFWFRSITLLASFSYADETYTDQACRAAAPTMNACAANWDQIRQNCTAAVTTNTVWPGPCECSYYANDLPCFDDQALCAHQLWTQAPQWLRDGVTSCLMKDESYTIRASLGPVGNPFLVSGIAGNATRTVASTTRDGTGPSKTPVPGSAANALDSASPSTGQPEPYPDNTTSGLSTEAKIGVGVGIGVGGLAVSILGLMWFLRKRRIQAKLEHTGAKDLSEVDSRTVYPDNELGNSQINEVEGGSAKHEADGVPMNEMGQDTQWNEADGIPKSELDGKTTQRYELAA